MYLSSPAGPNPPLNVAQRQLRGTRDGSAAASPSSVGDLIAPAAGIVDGKQLRVLSRECRVQQLRRIARDAALKQRPFRPGIDDGRAELAQLADRAFDEIDALLVGLAPAASGSCTRARRRCAARPGARALAKLAYGCDGLRPTLNAVSSSFGS